MTGPHLKKDYSAADIERYHSGHMTPEEAHALERAALDDLFLSDAIDGYVHTATPAMDVAFLKDRLKSRSEKVVALPKRGFPNWLRVAALLVLLVGCGWLVYKFSGNSQMDLADQTTVSVPQSKSQPTVQPAAADSVSAGSTESEVTRDKQETVRTEEPTVVESKVVAPTKTFESKDQARVSKTGINSREIVADSTAVSKTASPAAVSLEGRAAGVTLAKAAPIRNFKARVVDAQNNAVPYAMVTDPKHNTATLADAVGAFTIAAPDSNLTVAVDVVGFQRQYITLNPQDTSAAIVLQRTDASLSEVVVTGYGTKKRGTEKVRLEAVEPVGGWKQLNDYVSENATQQAEDADEDREVTVSFDVDKQGNAIDITVDKPLCPACDTSAIRIIREGSKWKKKENTTRAKAYIRF